MPDAGFAPPLLNPGNERGGRPKWPQQSPALRAIIAFPTSRLQRIRGYLARTKTEGLLPELAALIGFLILLWAGIVIDLDHEYHAARAAATQSTSNLVRAFEESTRRTISEIDEILLSARAFHAAQGARFNFDLWARTQTLPDQMAAAIGMADRTGHVFADTVPIPPNTSIADRPHFQAQIDPKHDDLFISNPVHGRVSGKDSIQFTRKLLDPNGEFAGVTVFSLGCDELSRLYQSLELGNGFVSLLSAEGVVLARGPLLRGLVGTGIRGLPGFDGVLTNRSGAIQFYESRSGTGQIASFRHLKAYPLIVMVGLDTNTVFRQYRSLRRSLVQGGTGITLGVIVIAVFWLNQKRRTIVSQQALTVTLNTISQGILMVDGRGRVPVINPRALDLLGLPEGTSGESRKRAASRAIDLCARRPQAGAHTVPTRDGERMHLPAGDSRFETVHSDGTIMEVRCHTLAQGGFVHTYTDVTEQRRADARVRYLAHHDTLTGLANRAQLRQYLPDFLDRRANRSSFAACMVIDLDGFKGVNDTLGHDAGDQLLVQVAQRLKALVREVDFLARLGGDEFIILQSRLRHPEDAEVLARRVLLRLADPIYIAGQQVRIGASIGIAFHPRDGQDGDTLFNHADLALYSAKASGRGSYRCFDESMTHAANERRLLENDLRRALDNHELEVHFQPQFACDSLEIAGFEALVRWRHPTRGYVSPETFIGIAEECGLINRLGRSILEQACTAAATWYPRHRIAVNVSPMQLREGKLQDDVAAILSRTGLPPNLLEVEVTESVMADDNQLVLDTLHALKTMGIRVALDDFGTGYSSLSYLRRFSFNKIKIDKSFVQGQASDEGVRVILEAISAMCHNLGLAVVGEGVETPQQLALLQRLGCTEVQGYLLGRPMPANMVEALLRKNGRRFGRAENATRTLENVELVL